MHSQLMFNECIAETRSRERRQRPQNPRQPTAAHSIHASDLDGRSMCVCMHVCIRVYACSRFFRVGISGSEEGSTYFPAADSGQEEQDIRLLLLLKLLDVLKGTHLDCWRGTGNALACTSLTQIPMHVE